MVLKGISRFWHYFKHFSEEVWFQVKMSSFPTQVFAKVGSIKFNFITNNSLATIPKVALSHNTTVYI